MCTSGCANDCLRCGVNGCTECQRGLYLNNNSGFCVRCSDRCQECTKANSCDLCFDPFVKVPIDNTDEDFSCGDKKSKTGLIVALVVSISLFLLFIGLCCWLYDPKRSFLYNNPD